jgi:hypothetical protein
MSVKINFRVPKIRGSENGKDSERSIAWYTDERRLECWICLCVFVTETDWVDYGGTLKFILDKSDSYCFFNSWLNFKKSYY